MLRLLGHNKFFKLVLREEHTWHESLKSAESILPFCALRRVLINGVHILFCFTIVCSEKLVAKRWSLLMSGTRFTWFWRLADVIHSVSLWNLRIWQPAFKIRAFFKALARAFHNKLARKICLFFLRIWEKENHLWPRKHNPERRQEEEKKVESKRSRKSGRIWEILAKHHSRRRHWLSAFFF